MLRAPGLHAWAGSGNSGVGWLAQDPCVRPKIDLLLSQHLLCPCPRTYFNHVSESTSHTCPRTHLVPDLRTHLHHVPELSLQWNPRLRCLRIPICGGPEPTSTMT